MSIEQVKLAVEQAGLQVENIGRYRLARLLGVSEKRARNLLREMREKSELGQTIKKELAESITTTESSMIIELPKTRIQTLEQLIEQFKVDTSVWRCKKFTCNKWEVGAKNVDGNLVVTSLFQVKADFERAEGWSDKNIKAEIDRVIAKAKEDIKPFNVNKIILVKPDAHHIAEIAICDHHFGSLSWKEETGQANYDLNIAKALYDRAFDDLLIRSEKCENLERIVMVIGNDLLNCDNLRGTTTKGTYVTNDTRFQKTYQATFDKIVRSIDKAAQIAMVDVIIMPGNHDTLTSYMLGHSLEAFYYKNKNVFIDNSPLTRKYYTYGHNLIGFTHGDKVKLDRLPLLMATERSLEFGNCSRREWHTGHLHHTKTIEENGVRVRVLPSLVAPNDWAAENGYTMTTRASQAFIWSKYNGLKAILEHSVPCGYEVS